MLLSVDRLVLRIIFTLRFFSNHAATNDPYFCLTKFNVSDAMELFDDFVGFFCCKVVLKAEGV